MFLGQPVLSIAAAGFYVLALSACVAAAGAVAVQKQPVVHLVQWILLALFFAVLLGSRLFDWEETLRMSLRASLYEADSYDARRDYQRPIVAVVLLLGAPVVFGLIYWVAQTSGQRRNLAVGIALFGGVMIAGVVVLRIISLHQVDALLYGPLKLNWFGDVGGTALVIAAAAYYVKLVSARK